jgi:hypothetical protein
MKLELIAYKTFIWLNKETGRLQTLIPSRCEHVPWVMGNQNFISFCVCLSVWEIYNKINCFSTDRSNLIKLGLNVFLNKVYHYKNVQVKTSFISEWQPFKTFNSKYLCNRKFYKILNARHFETKKYFDLKIFMMIDRNKNNH